MYVNSFNYAFRLEIKIGTNLKPNTIINTRRKKKRKSSKRAHANGDTQVKVKNFYRFYSFRGKQNCRFSSHEDRIKLILVAKGN